MSYENAPATIMLATNCAICGKPLADSVSVTIGLGPDCREGNNEGITEATREACNRWTYLAAIAAQSGNIGAVNAAADEIEKLGLISLAHKIRNRFFNAEKNVDITVVTDGDVMIIKTPYKRSADFVADWRNIPGRRYNRAMNANIVPLEQKPLVWALLRKYFDGKFLKSDKGIFRIVSIKH